MCTAFKIVRSAYHRGSFSGGHVKIFMKESKQILDRAHTILLENKRESVIDTAVKKLCDDVSELFCSWDTIVSKARKPSTKPDDVRELEDNIATRLRNTGWWD